MRIGELAGLVGISTRAIRHYHDLGLLAEPGGRTAPAASPAGPVLRQAEAYAVYARLDGETGFGAAFYADFAPAQAAAIRRAIELMKESTA